MISALLHFMLVKLFFQGIANSGELKRVKVKRKNGQSLKATLKLTVVTHNTSHVHLH